MRVLAIETSCDETAAAVVEDGVWIRSSVVASQLDTHSKYGGVVPELASREHLRAIQPVVAEALEASQTKFEDLAAIAVTEGPGLVGSLLVGITYAKAVCMAKQLPLIAVNHVEGHIHAVILEARQSGEDVEFSALALVVSGGHTHLFEVTRWLDENAKERFSYRLLGRTRDDAAGEAFDKVAKLLGFGYPGGPIIDSLAPYGNPQAVRFTSPKMKGNQNDLSFSGMKTAVLRWTQENGTADEAARRREFQSLHPHPSVEEWLALTPPKTLDLLASFQQMVIEELLRRIRTNVEATQARTVIISGGVACNAGLRQAAAKEKTGVRMLFPSPSLSTDNAVMIAAAAFPKLLRREFSDWSLTPRPGLSLV